MSESQQIVYRRKRESYRTGQRAPYRLRPEVKALIKEKKELFRFVEDYFHISIDSVYRYLKSDDPAFTQIGFLHELAEKLEDMGLNDFETLIIKA